MQCPKRLQKRSILGTRVSAPWSDGRFYCGVVENMTEQPNGQFMYSVLFDDGYSKLYFHRDIVGYGFNTTAGIILKHGQKVYVTHQGREVTGCVVKHSKTTNDVLIELECSNGELIEAVKRLDEVRLMESRRSARLNNDSDQSQYIDVPRTKTRALRYVHSQDGSWVRNSVTVVINVYAMFFFEDLFRGNNSRTILDGKSTFKLHH